MRMKRAWARQLGASGFALSMLGGTAGCGGDDALMVADAGPVACGTGTWVLIESGGACGACPPISDAVVLSITPDIATGGGTTMDSEGNSWTFQPDSCTAALPGACDASDTIDFDAGLVTCSWICGTSCPPCPATCHLQPF